MILGQLALENFSVYGGRQNINLAPCNAERPIVLIGGLNGAGKTSLLIAVKLALFGKRLMQLMGERISYSTFLRHLVHRRTSCRSAVELEFFSFSLGHKDVYRIRRAWGVSKDAKAVEEVTVWKNNQKDDALASIWDDFIDALLPASISHLFFFDGEKVAEMANEVGTSALLRTGIQALLGVDLLGRLQNDLADLIAKKTKATSSDEDAKRLCTLDKEIAEFSMFRGELCSQLQALRSDRETVQKQTAKIEARFKEAGGQLFLDRVNTEKELNESKASLATNTSALIELAAGALPLALVPNLLKAVQDQDRREQEADLATPMLDVLKERDQRVLSLVANISPDLEVQLEHFFAQDREQRAQASQTETYLHLGSEGRVSLARVNGVLAADRARVADLLKVRERIEARVTEAQNRFAMTPPKGALQGILAEREALQRQLAQYEQHLASLVKKKGDCEGALKFRQQERDRVLRRLSAYQAGDDVDSRVVRYAQKARERVGVYAQRIQERALDQLGNLILESLHQLFRKEGFVARVSIVPESYTLQLFDSQNQLLPLDRLSAGERQLVVIAILWGLGRASGRPLPLMIDTPLGRLDSMHRDNMLEYYLPTASHQTILLTTDAEITKADLPRLLPFVGGSHLLVHDDATRRTTIKSGFFWSAA